MNNKSKKINGGIAFLIVLILVFGVIISIVLVKANETEKIELPDYTSEIEENILLNSGRLYYALETTFTKGLTYNASLQADESIYLRNYVLTDTDLKIGDIVTQNQVLGYDGEPSNEVTADYGGMIVAVDSEQTAGKKTVVIKNNECLYAEFYIAEKDKNKFQYSTDLLVESNGVEYKNKITEIDYKLTNNGIKVTISVQDENFNLLINSKLSITRIEKNIENAICIPVSAIKKSFQSGFTSAESSADVFRTEKVLIASKSGNEYSLSYRFITIADENDEYYLITDGLSDGESIFVPDNN